MTQETWRVDDGLFKETTRELETELQKRGIEQHDPPDFDTVAARWRTRHAVGEEPRALKTYRFVVIVQPEDGQFRAYIPTLDGCEARGSTPGEVQKRLVKILYRRLTEMLTEGETPPSDAGAEIINVVLPAPSFLKSQTLRRAQDTVSNL